MLYVIIVSCYMKELNFYTKKRIKKNLILKEMKS